MIKILLLAAINLCFIACFDNKGNDIKQSNVDVQSYKDVAYLFKDNTQIQNDDKNILIIFGANDCIYCEKLKKEILQDQNLQDQIKNDFSSYYINISYKKIHTIKRNHTSDLSTTELSNLYNINATPTIVILNKKAKTMFNYPGFISAKQLNIIMNFLNKDEVQNLNELEIVEKITTLLKE
ncbi:SoxW family protein [Campylobacter insulaenigrae]|uniref:Thioredoxin-related protein, SoxW family n=1 Tax=Campylobacter insulaenigrae NCTC 12927 TaxID=1031564 RepID=A0A0A8H252_9BACT|nr:thioredoxin-related protein, SoxW family [Campylobacter insulaenigrae]AJC87755.1 thioredoxin-related protein, SoxW family [Campylobacter insulaenigrae NCTC 12927]VEH94048.1 Thioredoxin-related protein [Campylobacter insulaenigrae]